MAIPVIMPRQGQSVETCIITEWFKKPGDTVKKGEILCAYETDKASFELEAEADGQLLTCFYGNGDEVPVLVNIAVIGNAGEDFSSFASAAAPSEKADNTSASVVKEAPGPDSQVTQAAATVQDTPAESSKISPRARRKAESLGVATPNVAGTGPGGRIIERDIITAASTNPRMTPLASEISRQEGTLPSSGSGIGGYALSTDLAAALAGTPYEDKKLPNIRKIIAKAMHASLQHSAQLTHHMSADARRMLEWRKKIKPLTDQGKCENITLNDMVCYAVVRALKKHPGANAHFLGDTMRYFRKVHLGIAVDTERGLMVPVLRNADDLSIQGLSSQIRSLAETCKKGSIDPSLLASDAGSFTVSNLGAYGVEMFTPVLNVPQTGILGVNTIIQRPADLGNGVFGFIPVIGLSLTYDHRAIDGAPASAFLREIKTEIENLEINL